MRQKKQNNGKKCRKLRPNRGKKTLKRERKGSAGYGLQGVSECCKVFSTRGLRPYMEKINHTSYVYTGDTTLAVSKN